MKYIRCNNTSNKGLSHYFSKKQLALGKGKIWKQDKKNLLSNNYVIKNNADVIIFIRWLMLNPEDVLYLVSSDLSEVKCFYGSFSDAGQKVPLPFKS